MRQMDALPGEVLVYLLSFCGGRELGRLASTSSRFSSVATATPAAASLEPEPEVPEATAESEGSEPAEPALTVAELAARLALSRRPDAYRMELRSGETACFALYILEERLASPSTASAGYCHSALADRGSCLTFGSGTQGQLGLNRDPTPLPQPLHDMTQPLPSPVASAVVLDRAVRSVASAPLRSVVAVAAGTAHTLACTEDGDLLSWGDAAQGRLGIG